MGGGGVNTSILIRLAPVICLIAHISLWEFIWEILIPGVILQYMVCVSVFYRW